jgi:Plastocyanin
MTRLTRRSFLIAAAGAPVALAALPALAATHQVTIQGMAFSPATITIARGDTIRWTNADSAPHTATFRDSGMDTGRLNRGASGEITFDRAGSFDYICAVHPSMRGRVIVTG